MRTQIALALGCAFSFGSVASADPTPPPGIAAADMAKTNVCTDGKNHYVASAPGGNRHTLYYGDGKTMTMVHPDASMMVSGNDFLDPRFPNPTANPDFRGIDWRNYSAIEYDAEKKTCALRCGEKTQPWTIVAAADAKTLLSAAKYQPSPQKREPYALARDDKGNYYYVDRGATPETKANFQVWVGKKGQMKLQKMKDVAADSDGEVYSTSTGDLRFITEHDVQTYTWVHGAQKVTLRALPVYANLPLIYNTLGVYTGQRFGTPCDDF